MKWILQITIGVLHDLRMRRNTMFAVLLAAVIMLLAGSTFLAGTLEENIGWFLIYWAACGWLTLTTILLALYDLLAVRAESRRDRRALKKKVFGKEESEKDDR